MPTTSVGSSTAACTALEISGALFFRSSGFYRPIVGLTFAADYALFGTNPLGFGLTNVLFAGVCGTLLFLVGRELGLSDAAALLATALWLLNPHGINTAVLWMSGRTSLLLTMGSLAEAFELISGRRLSFWVEPELHYAKLAGLAPPCAGCAAARIDVRGR